MSQARPPQAMRYPNCLCTGNCSTLLACSLPAHLLPLPQHTWVLFLSSLALTQTLLSRLQGASSPLQPTPLPQPPTRVLAFSGKCHLDHWLFSHLLMSKFGFGLRHSSVSGTFREGGDRHAAEFVLAQGLEMGMGFAKDLPPKGCSHSSHPLPRAGPG